MRTLDQLVKDYEEGWTRLEEAELGTIRAIREEHFRTACELQDRLGKITGLHVRVELP